jgi:hypothetical protein
VYVYMYMCVYNVWLSTVLMAIDVTFSMAST